MIDLGPRSRIVFAAVFFAAQATLVLTASLRPEHAFGFQMFSESSTLSVHLMRRVAAPSGHGDVLVDVSNGDWETTDTLGRRRRMSWHDRVREPSLSTFDATMHASYGAEAQVARWHAALDDVFRHTLEDAETLGLVTVLTIRKNGREPYVVELTAGPR